MGLQDLPPELIGHILSYLPALSPCRPPETIGPDKALTPSICRVCHILRREALPLYARTSAFIIQTDEQGSRPRNRLRAWLDALGPEGISYVQNLQLSQHWHVTQPTRWQGHVGFYVRLHFRERERMWGCTAGTYPVANDLRGMRLESVQLMREAVMQRLRGLSEAGRGLEGGDVGFVVHAMGVVARHPISAFDTEQSESGKRQRRRAWEEMEGELIGLLGTGGAAGEGRNGKAFFTPY